MTIYGQLLAIGIFLTLTGAAVALEHMAFRTPGWRKRELERRAVGIATVMLLALLVLVTTGVVSLISWLAVFAGFCVSGAVKIVMVLVDERARRNVEDSLRDGYTDEP